MTDLLYEYYYYDFGFLCSVFNARKGGWTGSSGPPHANIYYPSMTCNIMNHRELSAFQSSSHCAKLYTQPQNLLIQLPH